MMKQDTTQGGKKTDLAKFMKKAEDDNYGSRD
jgi:hypothetical protein